MSVDNIQSIAIMILGLAVLVTNIARWRIMELISREEVLNAYSTLTGDTEMNELITTTNNSPIIAREIEGQIAQLEAQAKAIKEKQEELRQALLEEMEKKGIVKIDGEFLTLTYVQPTEREEFNKAQFRADNPDLYDEYIKMTPVKASLRIKVK